MEPIRKTIAIVNYNTTALTRAAVRSIRRHGGDDYRIVIFDNSDSVPFIGCAQMGDFDLIDNTEGKIIDFDAELRKYPKRNSGVGCAVGCTFGSAKHMMSVEWLLQNINEGFVLCDSDILVRESIDSFFDDTQAAIGTRHTNNPLNVPRIAPYLCWINAPMLRKAGIHYFDGRRSWGLTDSRDDRANWYDTGASLLEDIENAGLPWREVDVLDRHIHHLGSGSWKNKDNASREWLNRNRHLWDDTPYEKGIERVAMCAIVRLENDYLKEWIDWHHRLGVSKFFIYDNSRPGDERPVEVLRDLVDEGLVDIIQWAQYDTNCQPPAYNDCYARHGGEYAWIGFLDIDELVVLKKHKSIPELLNGLSTKADVVVMHWMMFGDSGLVRYDSRPMWERFTKPAPQVDPECRHAKSWVRGGLGRIVFRGDPHVPYEPTMRIVNPDGSRQQQQPISEKDEKSVAYIAHYFTKTVEEYVHKVMREYPCEKWYVEKTQAQAVEKFFRLNERTPEKVEILMRFSERLPYSIRIMEHLMKRTARWGYTQLIADEGYLIRSISTGQTYKEITVPDPNRFEVVPDPAQVKEKSKPKGRKRG